MRIIAGRHRGRIILPPADDSTRPITDRAKQSVFDILQPLIDGAAIYDCFAGTGSMGLECLSRGAKHATFFESGKSAGQLLKKNVVALQLADQSTILSGDLFKLLAKPLSVPKADLLFLDPPYRFLQDQLDALRELAVNLVQHHLAHAATVVFRHDAADQLVLPSLPAYDVRTYGGMTVEFLSAGAPPSPLPTPSPERHTPLE